MFLPQIGRVVRRKKGQCLYYKFMGPEVMLSHQCDTLGFFWNSMVQPLSFRGILEHHTNHMENHRIWMELLHLCNDFTYELVSEEMLWYWCNVCLNVPPLQGSTCWQHWVAKSTQEPRAIVQHQLCYMAYRDGCKISYPPSIKSRIKSQTQKLGTKDHFVNYILFSKLQEQL